MALKYVPGDGRCEKCTRKLVFLTQCEAVGCGRWICEHRLLKREMIGFADENLTLKFPDKVKGEFCSEECSCKLVDEYIFERKARLRNAREKWKRV